MNRRKLEAKVAKTPTRPATRSYHGAQQGYSVDEIDGGRVFHPREQLDHDEQRLTENLVISGVDEPFDDVDHPRERDEDREFVLDQQAYSKQTRHEHLADEQGIDEDEDALGDDDDERDDDDDMRDDERDDDPELERDLIGRDEDLAMQVNQRPMGADRSL